MLVSIDGIDKVKLLKQLWIYAISHEMYRRYALPSPKWNKTLAKEAVKGYIDIFQGRYICSDLSGNKMETMLYNKENRFVKAEKIIECLKSGQTLEY